MTSQTPSHKTTLADRINKILKSVFVMGVEVGRLNNSELTTLNENIEPSEAASAILKEVYEEVVKSLPEKGPEPSKETHKILTYADAESIHADGFCQGYNRAIDQFKSNLKLLIEESDNG